MTDKLQKQIELELERACKPIASAAGRLSGHLARRTIKFNDLSSIRADLAAGMGHIDRLMATIEREKETRRD